MNKKQSIVINLLKYDDITKERLLHVRPERIFIDFIGIETLTQKMFSNIIETQEMFEGVYLFFSNLNDIVIEQLHFFLSRSEKVRIIHPSDKKRSNET